MPSNSHSIFEEGAVFKSFKIVKEGVFQEEGKTMIFDNLLNNLSCTVSVIMIGTIAN